MKNVFLDLGTHYGQGLSEFIHMFNMNDSWIIHTFEANPVTHKIYKEKHHSRFPWVVSYNEAVSDHDGTLTFNIETPPNEGNTGMGSSAISLEQWDPWGNNSKNDQFQVQVEVSCINFSRFVRDNFGKDDNIVVKMDIEGSEYVVLEKMIEDGTIDYVNHLYVEWHARFFKNKEEVQIRQKNLIDKLKTYNLELHNWK
jgi:FkbM family methyltransferase